MASEWQIKREICDIGRRLYNRGFAAGNDGNISHRLPDDVIVCTPTQICKGFMKEDDLATVNLEGRQLSGKRPRTSEVLLHLEIYKADPSIRSVVHCHPPHATAFGVARVDIPSCVLPEVEISLGLVPRADYETPGGPSLADTVRPFIGKANTVVLSNHGTVSWGPSVERAYWYTEILDAYCRVLLLAKQIGNVERLSEEKVGELLDLREQLGAGVDPRRSSASPLCVNTEFARGQGAQECGNQAPAQPAANEATPSERTEFIQAVTKRVVAALQRQQDG